MNRDRRGFAPIGIALIVIVCIAVIGGVFYYFHKMTSAPAPVVNDPIPVATSTMPTASTTPTSTTTSSPITSYRSYLTPTSGLVGTVVTIHASGFAATGNQVTLDGMVGGSLNDLSSPDGKMLVFTVPSSLGPNCKPDQACPMFAMLVTPRAYTVAVISNGVTYNIGTFTVTGGGLQPPTSTP